MIKKPQTSLKESLFDNDLTKKDIGTLTVIVNALENFIVKTHTDNQWIKTLNTLIDNIKYNTDFRKRYPMSYDKTLKVRDDELYVFIQDEKLYLMSKGLYMDRPGFASIIIIGYTHQLKNIYADMYASATTDYKEMVNNEYFQWYKVTKDEIKLFNSEILDKIEQVF